MSAMRPVALLFLFLTVDAFAQDDRPNVLLLTIDTWRADYLGANGATHVRTPSLDRLAEGGANFTRARSPVPLTLPSHASILTGKDPPGHGVRDNGTFRLGEAETTLAEVLKAEGYATAAFVGAFVLDRRFGLAQGFDHYDDRTWSDAVMLESIEAERNAGAVYTAFSDWLAAYDRRRPFFVWIHLYDPHAPYAPPEPYHSQYAERLYAGEVAYVDAIAGQIVADLESKGLFSKTLIAVVGDHGEGLGEHQEMTHSLLIYNSTLHVPMMLHAPDLIPVRRRVDPLTRIIDLAPTLLDYLGVSARLGQGVSLRPLIEGPSNEESLDAYSESLYPELNLGWSELRGLEAEKYRFILAPQPELYDVVDDPGETRNRITELPHIARQLRRRLEERIEATSPAAARLDAETEARLRSLGYISRNPTKRTGNEARPDPKANMATWHLLQLAMLQFADRQYQSAVATLNEIVASEKHLPIVYEYLGSSYMKLENYARAAEIYRAAIAQGFESSNFHLQLGLIHFYQQELTQAREELEIALALDPLSVAAHYRLGDVFRRDQRFGEAIEHYRAALAVNPSYVYAIHGLGMSYAGLGQNEEALTAFREAVRVDPKGSAGYFNLAVQLHRMRRNQEALAYYREFLAVSQEGELQRERQRAQDAIRQLEESLR